LPPVLPENSTGCPTIADAGMANVPIANMESVIRTQIFPAAKRCYQRGLEIEVQEGRIVIAIHVDPDGSASSSRTVSNTGLNPQVEECILRAASRARFGCNPGGVVQVPFNFVINRESPDAAAP
jgi:hypothetical protein